MRYCTKCVLPDTHETVKFDKDGVCNICREAEVKHNKINWDERKGMLDLIVSRYKDKGEYDCIVPFSGGKDSAFQLWYVVTQLKLKPLVVRFDHWGYRALVDENNNRVMSRLNVDFLQFRPSLSIVKKLMKESLKRTGDFCWHCHTGIFAYSMQTAIRYNIPLLIWGESPAEYRAYNKFEELEELNEKLFNEVINLSITSNDMCKYLNGEGKERDLLPFKFPSKENLDKLGVKSIWLGNYIKWDTRDNVRIIKEELGWKGQVVEGIPPEYDYEKIECKFQGVRDYCKFIKRGHGRTNHLACIDIRSGRLDRETGMKMAFKYDGKKPKSLEYFLKFTGMSEEEFVDMVKQNKISNWTPNLDDFLSKIDVGEELPDMKDWKLY